MTDDKQLPSQSNGLLLDTMALSMKLRQMGRGDLMEAVVGIIVIIGFLAIIITPIIQFILWSMKEGDSTDGC